MNTETDVDHEAYVLYEALTPAAETSGAAKITPYKKPVTGCSCFYRRTREATRGPIKR